MNSSDTPDTGAGTPPEWIDLAADIRAVDGNHDLGAGDLAAALTARGWTRRPATDPAGLDAALAAAIGLTSGPGNGTMTRTRSIEEWRRLDRLFRAARLPVADGPGPEERLRAIEAAAMEWASAEDAVHGNDPAPSREAWDRAFAARAALRAALSRPLPENREEPSRPEERAPNAQPTSSPSPLLGVLVTVLEDMFGPRPDADWERTALSFDMLLRHHGYTLEPVTRR